jgi:hypothetical protein
MREFRLPWYICCITEAIMKTLITFIAQYPATILVKMQKKDF